MKDGKIAYDDTPKVVFSHANSLLDMSLDIPEATKIVRSLNAKGKNIPSDIITVDALKSYIMSRIDDRKKQI